MTTHRQPIRPATSAAVVIAVTLALLAAAALLGATQANASEPAVPVTLERDGSIRCYAPDGQLVYGNRQPDGSVVFAGYGVDGLIAADQRPGQVVYRDCTGPGWVDPASTHNPSPAPSGEPALRSIATDADQPQVAITVTSPHPDGAAVDCGVIQQLLAEQGYDATCAAAASLPIPPVQVPDYGGNRGSTYQPYDGPTEQELFGDDDGLTPHPGL